MKPGIYFIRNNKTKRLYLGQSANTPQRMRQHRFKLRHGSHSNPILQNSWNKDGEEAFIFQHMKTINGLVERCTEEVALLAKLRASGHNPYNIGEGGEGQPHTQESRTKLSKACMGKVVSDKTRRRMSESLKGIPCHPNCKAASSAYWKGRKRGPMSEEQKAKVSAAKKGKPSHDWSNGSREKLSQSLLGRRLSDETKDKMRSARLRVVATGFRTKGHKVTHNGETLYLSEWAAKTGIPHKTLAYHLYVAKWSVLAALETPIRSRKRH